MKKLLTIILIMSMLLLCISCGTTTSSEQPVEQAEQNAEQESEEQAEDVSSEVSLEGKRVMLALNALGDLSFNDLLYEGLLAIQDTYGLDVEYAEVGTDISTYEGYFFDFVDEGYDYVFLRSGFMELCETYAADYPDMRFIVYDTTPLDTCSEENVYLYSIATYQAAYLVGMAAAGTSETGVIGFVGGQENPLINDFLCGYIQGALYADENIRVCSAFIGDYNDAGKAMELATAQIGNNNADVIFAACGGASLGVFQTCKDKGVLAIGCDSDQYSIYNANGETELASVIMTSCLKKINTSLEAIMKDIYNAEDIFSDEQAAALGLSDGVTGVADNENYQKYVSEELRNQIAEAEQDIVSGKISVKSAYYMSQEEIDEMVNSVTP